jgi:hypothetical protein
VPTTWTDDELDATADFKAGRVLEVGLHDGDPGAAGTDNEASGGSPAYARLDPAWDAAGDEGALGVTQPATAGIAWGYVEFDVPAGAWTYLSFWGTGDVFLGSVGIPTQTTVAQDVVKVSLPMNATT